MTSISLRNGLRDLIENGLLIGAVLGIYWGLDIFIRYFSYLPEDSYYQPFIFIEIIKYFFAKINNLILFIMAAIFIVFGYIVNKNNKLRNRVKSIWYSWSDLPDGKKLRPLLMFVAFLMVWQAATYDVNLYFGQAHFYDRFLIIVFGVLLYWRPVFVFPFLFQFIAIFAQFEQPFGAYPGVTEFNFFARMWTLFVASFLLYIISGKYNPAHFLLLVCCLMASMYWGAGMGKMHLNWISHPYIYWLHLGAYSGGWLTFLEPETVVSITQKMSVVTKPLMVFTLFVEWGCLLILWRKKYFKIMLVAFVMFHTGVFATTGMFFWKWMAFEVALFLYFTKNKKGGGTAIFKNTYFLISVFVIAGSSYWFHPKGLSWYDTRLSYTFRLEAIGESGEKYSLPAYAFTPYSDFFTLGMFDYLNKEPQLTGLWDITADRAIADTLVFIKTKKEIFELEQSMGTIRFDAQKSKIFEKFITQYISNWNKRGSKRTFLSNLQPPPHLWNCKREQPFDGSEKITEVIIYQVTSFYDDEKYEDIRKRELRRYKINH